MLVSIYHKNLRLSQFLAIFHWQFLKYRFNFVHNTWSVIELLTLFERLNKYNKNLFTLSLGQVSSVVFEDCLKCMCYASSKCNLTFGCTSGQQILCGPFLISPEYWTESGRQVLPNDNPDRSGGNLMHFHSD